MKKFVNTKHGIIPVIGDSFAARNDLKYIGTEYSDTTDREYDIFSTESGNSMYAVDYGLDMYDYENTYEDLESNSKLELSEEDDFDTELELNI